jgi:hypothetical protein
MTPAAAAAASSGMTRTGLSGTMGGFMRHGVVVDLLFFLEPAVEDAQHLVVGGGGAGGAVGEELAEEGLQVGAGGVGEGLAAGAQERLGLAGAGQVLGDGVVGAVLARRCRAKGRTNGLKSVGSMWASWRTGKGCRSAVRPHEPPRT